MVGIFGSLFRPSMTASINKDGTVSASVGDIRAQIGGDTSGDTSGNAVSVVSVDGQTTIVAGGNTNGVTVVTASGKTFVASGETAKYDANGTVISTSQSGTIVVQEKRYGKYSTGQVIAGLSFVGLGLGLLYLARRGR